MFDKKWHHKAEIKEIGGDTHKFTWHFPRGTFEPRMSAYEIAAFLLPHMPSIVPLLRDHGVQHDFKEMYLRLATSPREVIDEILPWIKTVIHEDENDLVVLEITATDPQEASRKFYDGATWH